MADQPRRPGRGAGGSGQGNAGGGRSSGGGGPGKGRGKPAGRSGGRPAYGKSRSTGGPPKFRNAGGGRKPRDADGQVLSLKRLSKSEWAFVAPDCACERELDLEDAIHMREKQEEEIARDELLYLVADCHGFMAAHNLLGEMALEQSDVKLARGHYGFSYENGLKSIPLGFSGRLPVDQGYNAPFFDAGHGLARCLVALGRIEEAEKVLRKLAQLDPSEPDTQSLLSQLEEYKAGSAPSTIVSSGGLLPIITNIGPLPLVDDDEDDDDDGDEDD